jgi:decaprenyl-phosphate phosphoribosyltransferase
MTVLGTVLVAPASVRARARFPVALLRACRPQQWIKNGLVLAAPLAAGELLHQNIVVRAGIAIVAFTFAACAGYLVNDVLDVDADRQHPEKRRRPVAAGDLPVRSALTAAASLAGAAIALAALSRRPGLVIVIGSYLLITLAYSTHLKRLPYVEVFVVASGFLLRALAGALGTGVPPSRWFLVVCTCGALTVAFGKRAAELARVDSSTDTGREVILFYRKSWLEWCRSAAAAGTILAYLGWVRTDAAGASQLLATLSALPIAAALAVYIWRNNAGQGEAPEQLFLHDRALQLLGASWLTLFIASVQFG